VAEGEGGAALGGGGGWDGEWPPLVVRGFAVRGGGTATRSDVPREGALALAAVAGRTGKGSAAARELDGALGAVGVGRSGKDMWRESAERADEGAGAGGPAVLEEKSWAAGGVAPGPAAAVAENKGREGGRGVAAEVLEGDAERADLQEVERAMGSAPGGAGAKQRPRSREKVASARRARSS